MTERAYVTLDITNGNSEKVLGCLRHDLGVVAVDILEGPPDLILVIEAPNRELLAEFTVRVLSRIEMVTEKVDVLLVRNGSRYMEGNRYAEDDS
jgi:hypothetical protein